MARPEGLTDREGNYREVIPTDGYDVIEWVPGPDPDAAAPTAVCLVLPFVMPRNGLRATVMMRLKSRRAVDELVAVLSKHRDGVWPPT